MPNRYFWKVIATAAMFLIATSSPAAAELRDAASGRETDRELRRGIGARERSSTFPSLSYARLLDETLENPRSNYK
jgi:hypothetical protein